MRTNEARTRILLAGADSLDRTLVGRCSAIKEVRALIRQVAPTDSTVLLLGESGTGKEVIARGVHDCSSRAAAPFIPINCGAIPAELLETELFGHEKGAFTGAVASHRGRFELAEGGTLFLDEIGDMPLEMQVKLLRVLQERTFERVGSTRPIKCNVRVVAATHQNLEQKVEDGSFRMDLFYRLNVFPMDIPPLREREDDFRDLIGCFITQFEAEQRGSVRLMPDALEHLGKYDWPGNVRELANLVERLTILFPLGDVYAADLPEKYQSADLPLFARRDIASREPAESSLTPVPESPAEEQISDLYESVASASNYREDLSGLFAAPPKSPPIPSTPADLNEPIDLKAYLIEVEKALIIAALEKTGWVNAQAAKQLSLQRTTLVEKMRKYGIQRDD